MVDTSGVKSLLEKDVDRKEFLQYVGVGALGVLGITTVIKNLEELFGKRSNHQVQNAGYGSSPYGR